MTRGRTLRQAAACDGLGVVELAVMLPVLLFIIFGGLAIGIAYRDNQALQYLAKEIGASAFRSCSNSAANGESVDTCLDQVLNQAGVVVLESYPGATLLLSAYRWDPAQNPPPRLVSQRRHAAGGSADSEIQESDFYSDLAVADQNTTSNGRIDDPDGDPGGEPGDEIPPTPPPANEVPPTENARRSALLQREQVLIYCEIKYRSQRMLPGFISAPLGKLLDVYVVQSF